MSDINWRGIDLNLLIAFEAIMKHRSVSKAAEQLHLGQSAMSYNLNRLRKLFSDPLFERQGHIMMPTRRAEELSLKVHNVLEVIRNDILFPVAFDPAESQQKIVIGLSDYAEQVFGPDLFDQLTQESPQCRLIFKAVDQGNCQAVFDEGNIDLVVGVFGQLPEYLIRDTLYRERHVCLFDNRVLKVKLPISTDDYLNTPQAIVSPTGSLTTSVDETLALISRERRVVLGSSRFLTLRHLLSGRRLLCVMAEMLGRSDLFDDQLTVCNPPINIPDFDIELVTHKRDIHHPRMIWLAEKVKQVIQDKVESFKN